MAARDARVQHQHRQRGHAAHRVADHAGQLRDAQRAHHLDGSARAVFDRQLGEIEAVGFTGSGVERGRTGRALAAAQRVHAHHEPAIGIDRLAGPDHRLPPARCRVGIVGCGMRVR
ncbi:hypothetical protein G6F22_019842 [Rhizopus arrhizus]|nr:hypothetical protein G6F22_019842 [Rhizopus arrhizus]